MKLQFLTPLGAVINLRRQSTWNTFNVFYGQTETNKRKKSTLDCMSLCHIVIKRTMEDIHYLKNMKQVSEIEACLRRETKAFGIFLP